MKVTIAFVFERKVRLYRATVWQDGAEVGHATELTAALAVAMAKRAAGLL